MKQGPVYTREYETTFGQNGWVWNNVRSTKSYTSEHETMRGLAKSYTGEKKKETFAGFAKSFLGDYKPLVAPG